MQFTFESEIWEEDGQYVARANPFNVMTCASTKQEVQAALLEAVELFLETAQDMGTLEDILVECGYKPSNNSWVLMRQYERRYVALEL
jgi:predicted RNase H-like HicB family nuclease